MSSLRYRGAGLTAAQLAELGKVLIDASDTTADFLSPKLLVSSNLTKTIQNIGGNENILLDVSLSGIETTLDGRYVLLAPSGKNQTIQPLTDNIPLTLKGFAGAASDLLDLLNSAGTKLLTVGPSGATLLVPSADVLALTVKGFAGGLSDILDMYDSSSPQVLKWQVLSSGILKHFASVKEDSLQFLGQGNANPSLTLGTDANSHAVIKFGSGSVAPDAILSWYATGTVQLSSLPSSPVALVLSGQELFAILWRIRTNGNFLAIDNGSPLSLARDLPGHGAANVSVPKNATSLSVSFVSYNEPDTAYQICAVPSWNTTVYSSSKATTGFTLNFGTGAPVGATIDWTIERIVIS